MITGNPSGLLNHPSLLPPFPNHTMNPYRRLSLPENPVNFLKVIVSDDTQSTGIVSSYIFISLHIRIWMSKRTLFVFPFILKQRLPMKFTEKHGKNLLERAILKVPNGDVWQVGLQKSRGEIWLEDGWSEFADHYGINYGHLLMFKYEGFSIFSVIIFNTSASEIVYPLKKKDRFINSIKEVAKNNEQEVIFTKVKTEKSEEKACSPSEDESIVKCFGCHLFFVFCDSNFTSLNRLI